MEVKLTKDAVQQLRDLHADRELVADVIERVRIAEVEPEPDGSFFVDVDHDARELVVVAEQSSVLEDGRVIVSVFDAGRLNEQLISGRAAKTLSDVAEVFSKAAHSISSRSAFVDGVDA